MTLPEIIPLFPLPNVVFFPRIPLPLHVFEPRYRDMVRDAVRGARLIGMVLLRGNWEDEYHGTPPIFAVGTVGEIVRCEELPEGRFNIVLRGLREYRIVREVARGRAYREAAVVWRAPVVEPLPGGIRETIMGLVRRYLVRLGIEPGENELVHDSVDDETFVNFFAQSIDVAPLEKQALLEAETLVERARRLVDVLEFRLEELRSSPRGGLPRAH